jgi:hypothetical protein
MSVMTSLFRTAVSEVVQGIEPRELHRGAAQDEKQVQVTQDTAYRGGFAGFSDVPAGGAEKKRCGLQRTGERST